MNRPTVKDLMSFLEKFKDVDCVSVRHLSAVEIVIAEELVGRKIIRKTSTSTDSVYHLNGVDCSKVLQ